MTQQRPQRTRPISVTIRDVAEAAQVSATAVSRHFNHRIVLPPETAQRIEQAAETLGYRPNVAARRLSTGSSESLGVIVSDIAYPFFAAIASAAEAECARQGYGLLIFNSRNRVENEIALLHRIEDQQVDGVILLTNHPGQPEMVETIARVRNVVLVDEDVPGADATRLFAQNREGAEQAVRHLLENGHRRIAILGGNPELLSTAERLQGYRKALGDAGIAHDPALELFPGYTEAAGEGVFDLLDAMEEPPTAIFACGDMIAIGLLRRMHSVGLRIPDAVSLIGFDDTLLMDMLDPPLTTVRQSTEAFGRRAIQLLLDRIFNRAGGQVTEYLPVELVKRGSVGAPRVARHWRPAGQSVAAGSSGLTAPKPSEDNNKQGSQQ